MDINITGDYFIIPKEKLINNRENLKILKEQMYQVACANHRNFHVAVDIKEEKAILSKVIHLIEKYNPDLDAYIHSTMPGRQSIRCNLNNIPYIRDMNVYADFHGVYRPLHYLPFIAIKNSFLKLWMNSSRPETLLLVAQDIACRYICNDKYNRPLEKIYPEGSIFNNTEEGCISDNRYNAVKSGNLVLYPTYMEMNLYQFGLANFPHSVIAFAEKYDLTSTSVFYYTVPEIKMFLRIMYYLRDTRPLKTEAKLFEKFLIGELQIRDKVSETAGHDPNNVLFRI